MVVLSLRSRFASIVVTVLATTMLVVHFDGKNPTSVNGQVQPIEVPRQGAFLCYWPFDKDSGRYPLFQRAVLIDIDTLDREAINFSTIVFKPGPFKQAEASISRTAGHDYAVRNPFVHGVVFAADSKRLPRFTVSLWHYRDNDVARVYGPPGVLFLLKYDPFLKDYETMSIAFYGSAIEILNKDNVPLSRYKIGGIHAWNKWQFYTYTSDGSTLRVYHHLSAVEVFSVQLPSFFVKAMQLGFPIMYVGSLFRHERLACVTLFDDALSQAFVQQLPCICQSRGQCRSKPDFLVGPYKRWEKRGGRDICHGFFPMFPIDQLFELTDGIMPESSSVRLNNDSELMRTRDRWNWTASYVIDRMQKKLSQFTISMLLLCSQRKSNVIAKAVAFNYKGWVLALTVGRNCSEISFNPPILPAFTFQLEQDDWNFFAYTYDGSREASFITPSGVLTAKVQKPLEIQLDTNHFHIGPYYTNDEVASSINVRCIGLFSEAYKPDEMLQYGCICPSFMVDDTLPLSAARGCSSLANVVIAASVFYIGDMVTGQLANYAGQPTEYPLLLSPNVELDDIYQGPYGDPATGASLSSHSSSTDYQFAMEMVDHPGSFMIAYMVSYYIDDAMGKPNRTLFQVVERSSIDGGNNTVSFDLVLSFPIGKRGNYSLSLQSGGNDLYRTRSLFRTSDQAARTTMWTFVALSYLDGKFELYQDSQVEVPLRVKFNIKSLRRWPVFTVRAGELAPVNHSKPSHDMIACMSFHESDLYVEFAMLARMMIGDVCASKGRLPYGMNESELPDPQTATNKGLSNFVVYASAYFIGVNRSLVNIGGRAQSSLLMLGESLQLELKFPGIFNTIGTAACLHKPEGTAYAMEIPNHAGSFMIVFAVSFYMFGKSNRTLVQLLERDGNSEIVALELALVFPEAVDGNYSLVLHGHYYKSQLLKHVFHKSALKPETSSWTFFSLAFFNSKFELFQNNQVDSPTVSRISTKHAQDSVFTIRAGELWRVVEPKSPPRDMIACMSFHEGDEIVQHAIQYRTKLDRMCALGGHLFVADEDPELMAEPTEHGAIFRSIDSNRPQKLVVGTNSTTATPSSLKQSACHLTGPALFWLVLFNYYSFFIK